MSYFIRTEADDQAFEDIDQTIIYLKEQMEKEQEEANFLVVKKLDAGYIEIARGLGDLSIIYYTPEDEREPMIVTCNKTVDRAKSNPLRVRDLSQEYCEVTSSNTIPKEKAIEITKRYLQGQEFKELCDWYIV